MVLVVSVRVMEDLCEKVVEVSKVINRAMVIAIVFEHCYG